jgi:hypothetical protein
MSEENKNIINLADKIADKMMKGKQQFSVKDEYELSGILPLFGSKEEDIASKLSSHFMYENDISMGQTYAKEWEGWKPCGFYDFNNPPIIQREDDFAFGLTPELLRNILVVRAKGRGDGDKMYHAQMMGLKYDAFVVKNPGTFGPEYEVFFNAQLIEASVESEKEKEYSAWYVGLYPNIARPKSIIVSYLDVEGNKCLEELEGGWARYFLQGWEMSRGHASWKNAKTFSLTRAKQERKKIIGNYSDINGGKIV